MANTITIDPATRLEGHLKVTATYDAGKVASAKSGGMMFRGFENLLIGKDPRDAAQITQRICGVCPTNHAMAACLAMEALSGFSAPDNARIIRNLILGADFIQSHILHFYHLALPSYAKFEGTALAMPPWTPSYGSDLRLSAADNQRMLDHYVQALAARRQAHEMATIFAGKMPHTVAYEFGGVTAVPNADSIGRFRTYLNQIISFVDNVFLPDVDLLGQVYGDYYQIGRGYGNLIAFGVFDLNAAGSSRLLARGRVANAGTAVQPVDLGQIVEQTNYSWYSDPARNPSQGTTTPSPDKAGAYSWLKAPRYGGVPYEGGALARMWVNGDYRRGISVMDRHQARAKETSKIAHAMLNWLGQINVAGPVFTARRLPSSGTGVGLTEAPRGALGHWLRMSNGAVASYQILTPTCWNCSPADASGASGPLENALVGTPVADPAKPVEVLRVIQSFDPCLSCAVH
jgi:hydrogenase large subunit